MRATRFVICAATLCIILAPAFIPNWPSTGGCMSHVLRAAKWFVVVVALAGAFARPAHAQNTGVIEGTITDEQGGVMPGVTVTLRNTETGVERTVITEADGKYRFPA